MSKTEEIDTGADPDSGRHGSWFQTFQQIRFFLLDPRADEVDPRDIAHHLSMQCRFNGACKKFYSVAEHCVRVSWAVEDCLRQKYAGQKENGTVPDDEVRSTAFWGLMHDAAEAYVGDMVRPLKVHDQFYNEVEAKVMAVICERFGMALEEPSIVRHFDMVMLATEKRDVCTGNLLWSIPSEIKPLTEPAIGWSPSYAENGWLERFTALGGKL